MTTGGGVAGKRREGLPSAVAATTDDSTEMGNRQYIFSSFNFASHQLEKGKK